MELCIIYSCVRLFCLACFLYSPMLLYISFNSGFWIIILSTQCTVVSLLNRRTAIDLTWPPKEGRTFGGSQMGNQVNSPARLQLEANQMLWAVTVFHRVSYRKHCFVISWGDTTSNYLSHFIPPVEDSCLWLQIRGPSLCQLIQKWSL